MGALVREVRRWDLLALVVNTIIGAGIFGLPSRVFALAGPYSLLAYVVCAIPVLLIVLCFAEVGSRFTTTGGPYLYATIAFGPLVGFEIGWLLWLARVTSLAALSNLFVSYLSYLLPSLNMDVWRGPVIAFVIIVLTIVNVVGVRMTTRVSNFFTVGKVLPLTMFVLAGLFFIEPRAYSFSTLPSYGGFSQAALLLVFAFTGFEAAVISAGETRDPRRDVPFALLAGIGLVATLYLLIQIVAIGTLPSLATSERPLADASRQFLGSAGALVISLGALLSVTGTMNASIFAIPRLLYAMAEQGQLPRPFLSVHRRFHTPHVAIITTGAVILLFAMFSSFLSAATISAIIRLLVYMSTCAALPVLRRMPGSPAAFSIPVGPFVAAAACVLSIWLLSSSTWHDAQLVAGAVVVGIAIYAVVRGTRGLTRPAVGI